MSDYKLTRDAAGKVTTQYGQMLKNLEDDLVKQARHNANADMPHHASVSLIEQMANRIEELEADNKRLNEQMDAIEEMGTESLNALPDCLMRLAPALVENGELKDKLAKAVEALELALELADNGLVDFSKYGLSCDADINKHYRTTLAELKGQDDVR